MNTEASANAVTTGIPLTFNDSLPSYTVVGGKERRASSGLSAVILNRGGLQRYTFFRELEKSGFDSVLSMENPSSRYDLEDLSAAFPFVRFILLKDSISSGEEINLAASELNSPLFFVMRNDMRILRGGTAERMAERLESKNGNSKGEYKRLCTVPLIQDINREIIPTLITPALITEKNSWYRAAKTSIKTIPFTVLKEGLPSLYPFGGIGIYDRERFIRFGGFDPSIKMFYWQLMDFGFRSGLWGEEIAATQLIKLSYESDIPEEDSTAGMDFLRFFLKNISPVFRGDYAHLPLRRFFSYFRLRGSFFEAKSEFRTVREWVKINRYRWNSDARTITERFVFPDDIADDNLREFP